MGVRNSLDASEWERSTVIDTMIPWEIFSL